MTLVDTEDVARIHRDTLGRRKIIPIDCLDIEIDTRSFQESADCHVLARDEGQVDELRGVEMLASLGQCAITRPDIGDHVINKFENGGLHLVENGRAAVTSLDPTICSSLKRQRPFHTIAGIEI